MGPAVNPEDVPDEWVHLAVRANADRNHVELCGCIAWPEQCVSGYTPTQWEHGDEAHMIAAVLPAHERQVRERVAAEITAARPFSGNPGPQHKHYTMGLIRAARIARGES